MASHGTAGFMDLVKLGSTFTACELCGFLGLLQQFGPLKASMLSQVFVTEHCTPLKKIAEDIVHANVDMDFGLHMLASALRHFKCDFEVNQWGMAVCLYADQLAEKRDFTWLDVATDKLGPTAAAYGLSGQVFLQGVGLERLLAAEGVRIVNENGELRLVTDSSIWTSLKDIPGKSGKDVSQVSGNSGDGASQPADKSCGNDPHQLHLKIVDDLDNP